MQEVTLSLPSITLSGLQSGDKPKILCLHGWLDNAASFQALMQAMPDTPMLAVDWPGHGKSQWRSGPYHFVDWVEDVYQIIEQHFDEPVTVIGHSMGGMVASAFCAAFGEKVRQLILIESAGVLSMEESQAKAQLRKGILSRQKTIREEPVITPEQAISAREAVSDFSRDLLTPIVMRNLEPFESGMRWRTDRRLRYVSPWRFSHTQALELLKDIEMPTCAIQGEKGYEMVEQGLQHFGDCYRQLTRYKVPGGHHPHIESAFECAQILSQYLEKQK